MVNPVPQDSSYSSAYQQEPQQQGGSRVKSAIAGGLVLGVVGAGCGATFMAPKKVNNIKGILENDVFEKSVNQDKLNSSSEDVLQAKQTILDLRTKVQDVAKDNENTLKKIFKDEMASSVDVNDAMKELNPKYPTLQEAQARLTYLEEKAASNVAEEAAPAAQKSQLYANQATEQVASGNNKIAEFLKNNEGKRIKRSEFNKMLAEAGYSKEEIKSISTKALGSVLNPMNIRGPKVSDNSIDVFTVMSKTKEEEKELAGVLKVLGHENPEQRAYNSVTFGDIDEKVKKAKAQRLKAAEVPTEAAKAADAASSKTAAAISAEELAEMKSLKEHVGFLQNTDLLVDGKLSKDKVGVYLESKNPIPTPDKVAEDAFGKIKKFIKKDRLKGVMRIGGIALATGVLFGAIIGGKKKEQA